MRGKNKDAPDWDLFEFVYKNSPFLFKKGYHIMIVDNLVFYIDRSAKDFQSSMDCINGTHHSCTETTHRNEQELHI
jgi:hypothetical protein